MNLDVSHRTQLIRIGWSHLYKVVTSELKRVSRSLLSRVTCHVWASWAAVSYWGGEARCREKQLHHSHSRATAPQPGYNSTTAAPHQSTRELPAAGLSRWSPPVNQGYWTWDGSWILDTRYTVTGNRELSGTALVTGHWMLNQRYLARDRSWIL